MRFDQRLTLPSATTDADPVTAPQNVPKARTFRLRKRESANDLNSDRLVLALLAPVTESVSVEVWALDDVSDAEPFTPAAGQNWVKVASFVGLQGGESRQTIGSLATDSFVSGGGPALARDRGLFYARIVSNSLTTARTLLVRPTV
jgi:hypothetical protein